MSRDVDKVPSDTTAQKLAADIDGLSLTDKLRLAISLVEAGRIELADRTLCMAREQLRPLLPRGAR